MKKRKERFRLKVVLTHADAQGNGDLPTYVRLGKRNNRSLPCVLIYVAEEVPDQIPKKLSE